MRRIAYAFALILAAAVASGQSPDSESAAGPAESQSAASQPAGSQPGEPQPPAPPTATELVSSTLPSDIETASYYELVAWCQELKLDDSGARKELQSRLYAHYKIVPEAAKPKTARTISVRSAKESDYFTVEEIGQKYISLRGNVVVVLTDSESGTVQEIHSQSLVYNQTLNIVTATGGVEYSTVRNGTKETFTGESLTFDVNTWEGTFYDGRTVRPQKRSGQDVSFYFDGDTISRLENDTVIMDNGGFTSCEIEEAPHFQIRANRVWILAPGEWALQNAVLFIGRVPTFYFPFFFYPGDELFFNPSIGFDDVKGEYLQTTTYLIGRKKKSEEDSTSFSFMQLQGDSEADYDLELRGLFLRKIPAETDGEKKAGPTLKLLLDGYSRLGFFLGIEGDFSPLTIFKAGLAKSRSLFPIGTGYSPFFILPDGTETSFWNESSIFGLPVPFRFGMSGNLNASADFASISSHFEYYSDPFFTKDFYARSEGMKFTANLENLIAPSEAINVQSTLSWDVNSKLDFTRLLKTPWIQSLTVPYLSLKFTWQSRETPTTSDSPFRYDPGRQFYYPSSLVAPSVALSMVGDFFKYNSAASASSAPPKPAAPAPPSGAPAPEPARQDPGKGFRAPLTQKPAESPKAAAEKSGHLEFLIPQRRKDEPLAGREVQNTIALSYMVQPRATMEQSFDSKTWMSQEDVDFAIQYGTFETGGSSQVQANAEVLDRLLRGSLALTADGGYRMRFNPSDSLEPTAWRNLLLGDLQQDKFNLKYSFNLTLNPFSAIPMFAATNVAYRLTQKLYGITMAGPDPLNPIITEVGPVWDLTSVSEHSVTSTFSLKATDQAASLALSAQLPPKDINPAGNLDFTLWMFSTHIQTGATKPAGVWLYNPLIIRETINLSKDFTGSEELQFDINAPRLEKSTSQLKLWGFTASFTAQNMIPTDGLGVAAGSEKSFVPASLRLGYDLTVETLWLWKNRIKLDGALRTGWNQNLQKYIDNSLDFSFSLNASVYKFLELTVSSVSYNNKMYRYIPPWADGVDEVSVNPFYDLLRSFNFFNADDRYASAFKLRNVSIKTILHFHDWDVSFEYQGAPKLTTVGAIRQYQWTPSFAIQVKWIAIPEVNGALRQDTSGDIFLRE